MTEPNLQPARELIALGKFPEAAELLEKLRRKNPKHLELTHALALAFAQMGMLDRALPLFEEVARHPAADAPAHMNAGTAFAKAGRVEAAISAFRKSLALNPDLSGAHYNLGLQLAESGPLDEAADHLRTAARANPEAAVFWRDLARVEARRENWSEAIRAYRACNVAEPCHLDARQELALVLEKSGHDDEALAEWTSLVEEAPLLPAPRNHLISQLARRGDIAAAEIVAREGTTKDPGNADFHHNLGTLRSMQGNAAGALDAFRRALLLDPTRLETGLATQPADPPAARADLEHASPFSDSPHRIGVLTFRAARPDDLSRALAHLLPALLAEHATGTAELRHVAPFTAGGSLRADVYFDYLDPAASHLATLTRSLNVERWIFGDISPDVDSVRVRTWTAGSAADQSETVPLDLTNLPAALARIAVFARLTWAPPPLPRAADLLHFAYGATARDADLAADHLLAAVRNSPFTLAESEFLRWSVLTLRSGDAHGAIRRAEALLSIRPSARALFLKGQALFSTQDFDGARAAWDSARGLDPALTIPPVPAGWLEIRAGRLSEAEKRFMEAVADPDDGPAALVGIGIVRLAGKDPKGARERFLEALSRSPKLPEALFEMALAWLAEGNSVEAAKWGAKLEQNHPEHPLVEALAKVMGR